MRQLTPGLSLSLLFLIVASCESRPSVEPQAAAAPVETSGVVDSGGANLHYAREGSGPAMVIIGSVAHYSRSFSPELRKSFELIFVDSRHFVPSYQPSQEELASITLETLADDVEVIRSKLGIEKWVVLGHSAHGQIALAYASKYPERTSRLVLVAAVPFANFGELGRAFWDEHASQERKDQHIANRAAIEAALEGALDSRQFALNYIGNAALYWVDPAYDSTPLWEGVETNPVLGRLFSILPTRDEVQAILRNLPMPTLLVLGRLDFGVPHTAWEALIEDVPQLDYVLLDDSSHNPQVDTAEVFDRELVRWLQGEVGA